MDKTERFLKFFLVLGRLEKKIAHLKSLYMKEAGLNGSDLPILLALADNPDGLRQEQLREITDTDKAQISRTLRGLSQKDMVFKEAGSPYKSKYFLSEQGKEITASLRKDSEVIFESVHMRLGDESWAEFYAFADRLAEQMDREIEKKKETAVQAEI